ncbi:NADH-quinone oxidoreductase subunit H [bacterium]|nr:NADH-quinone oxidoreductase subunit H [bacterium]
MMDTINILIFPGLIFTIILALFVAWVDRKVTARVQWRVGPPLLQPLFDFTKLMGKETMIPGQATAWLFYAAPIMALTGALVFSFTLWNANLYPDNSMVGDLIVVVYLAMIPSVAFMLGGLVSGSPHSVLGASREIKLLLGDELIIVMALMVVIIQSGGSIKLGAILDYQRTYGAVAWSPSGMIALILAILAMQAKLALVPFDMSEAETEIMGGTLVAYSGPLLAFFKLTQWIMRAMLPLLLVHCFWGGIIFSSWVSILAGLGKLLVFWVIMILIRNTNPRVRIDQALKFFTVWGGCLGVLAMILAMLGY